MPEISEKTRHLEMSIPATLENIDHVSRETRRFLILAGIENHAFEILLIMREALNNAVEHGSGCNPDKIIRYGLRVEENELVMEITDEGNGFDWRTGLEKEPEPNSDRGRGLMLMKEYALNVGFNEKGNRLVLRKRIDRKREVVDE